MPDTMTHRTIPPVTRPSRAAQLRRRLGADGAPPAIPESGRPAARRPAGEPQRIRAAGGPADTALYACGCGAAFHAEVSAAVACPQCGREQAW